MLSWSTRSIVSGPPEYCPLRNSAIPSRNVFNPGQTYSGAIPIDILHFPARVIVTSSRTLPIVVEELSGAKRGPMIVSITTARSQQRCDHRLRHLVQRTGDVTVATNLGVPRSTARGWLGEAPTVVVCLDVVELTEPELREEVLQLRRRVQKLTALLRLALALLRTSGFRLAGERLPSGRAKLRILRAVDRAREYVRAVSTDILQPPARVVVTAADGRTPNKVRPSP